MGDSIAGLDLSQTLLIGVRRDQVDTRDYKYTRARATSELPRKVDLRKYVGEIENQLDTGSCVANASVSALELIVASQGKNCDLSRLFVYWNVREPYSYLKGLDKGAYLRDGFKSINKQGVPDEKDWEFERKNLNVKPPKEVYEKAKQNRVVEYKRITKRDIKAIKDALASGYPVIFSTAIGKQFLDLQGELKTQKYGPVNNWSNKLVGYHAMVIVGYDDSMRSFIVENSWSDQWGDNGMCKFPYINITRDAIDLWVCTKFVYQREEIKPNNDTDADVDIDDLGEDNIPNKFTEQEVNILKKMIKFYNVLVNFFKS